MTPYTWVVEAFHHGLMKTRRKFRTVEQAVDFANDWHDRHDDDVWDVQIITPSGRLCQTNRNGNQSAATIAAGEAL